MPDKMNAAEPLAALALARRRLLAALLKLSVPVNPELLPDRVVDVPPNRRMSSLPLPRRLPLMIF